MTVTNEARSANPQMSDEFARIYEQAAHRITVPVSQAALDLNGDIGPGTLLLDIAAGAGALSVPAAKQGAAVMAVDVAPGMVRRLKAKLAASLPARPASGMAKTWTFQIKPSTRHSRCSLS